MKNKKKGKFKELLFILFRLVDFLFDEVYTSETCPDGSEKEVSLKRMHSIPIIFCTYIYS